MNDICNKRYGQSLALNTTNTPPHKHNKYNPNEITFNGSKNTLFPKTSMKKENNINSIFKYHNIQNTFLKNV